MEELCEQFTLKELENEKLHVEASLLDEVLSRGNQCLQVKLCPICPFNREAFKNTLRKFWHPVKPVCFHELGFGLLLAKFEEFLDKTRVVRESPWNFDRNLVLC